MPEAPTVTKAERIKMFIDSPKTRPSVEGQNGSAGLRFAALAIVVDFDCEGLEAYNHLQYYNVQKASPVWGEKDIRRALQRAEVHKMRHPEQVGSLLNAQRASAASNFSPRPAGKNAGGNSAGRGPARKPAFHQSQRSHASRALSDYPVSGRLPSRAETWETGIVPSVTVEKPEKFAQNAGSSADFARSSVEKGHRDPENRGEVCKNQPIECPQEPIRRQEYANLLKIFRSKRVFYRLYRWKLRNFRKECGRFPHACFVPEAVANELPLRFPRNHPECLILPDNDADSLYFGFIDEAEFDRLFHGSDERGNP